MNLMFILKSRNGDFTLKISWQTATISCNEFVLKISWQDRCRTFSSPVKGRDGTQTFTKVRLGRKSSPAMSLMSTMVSKIRKILNNLVLCKPVIKQTALKSFSLGPCKKDFQSNYYKNSSSIFHIYKKNCIKFG